MNALKRRKSGIYNTGPNLMAGSVSSQRGGFPPFSGGFFSGRDILTVVPFTVPHTQDVPVSGGGAALQAAVTAAVAGDRLVITDSLTYDEVVINAKTNLSIEAASGQTPTIRKAVIVPNTPNPVISIQGACSGLAFRGLRFLGQGNRNALSQSDDGLLNVRPSSCPSVDRIIVEDCTFVEDATAPANGSCGILFTGTDGTVHQNVWVHRCTFSSNAAGATATGAGYGACTVGGFSNVYIQNCWVKRDNAVVSRAASNMRGVVVKSINVHVEDVLCEDLGTGGSDEAFKHNAEAIFGTAVGNSFFRNCVAYNCKRGYRNALAGTVMTVTRSVFNNDVAGIAAAQVIMQQSAGSLVVQDCVIAGAGDGTAFSATGTEDHNDVFNVAAPGKVLDATDQTIDPLFNNVPNRIWVATAPSLVTGGSDGGRIGVRYFVGELIFWTIP